MSLDERNELLNQKLDQTDLPDAVNTLIRDARRRRRQFKLLMVVILIDIILTVGLAMLTVKTHTIAAQSESNRDAIVAYCKSTNEARANNKLLWDHLIDMSEDRKRTPEQQKVFDDFKAFVNKTYAPRDCSNVVE